MKKQLTTLLLVSIASICYSQGFPVSLPSFKGQDFTSIQNNNNWNILTQASGDLNYDHAKDLAIVIESKDSIYEQRAPFQNEWVKAKVRVLLVLLNKNGKQIVHTQNNKFIARYYEGGDDQHLEPKLNIEKNKFQILQTYIHSSQSYTFQFKNDQFVITNAKNYVVDDVSDDFFGNAYDFKNHQLTVRAGNINANTEKVTTFEFKAIPKTLPEFNEMYEWEVMTDHFL